MSWATLVKYLIVMLLGAACLIGAYVGYRRYEIHSIVLRLGSDYEMRDLIPYGPMICTAAAAGFTNSMRSVTYVAGTHARADYMDFTGNGLSIDRAHTYYLSDGTIYYWSDTNPRGYVTNNAKWKSLATDLDMPNFETFDCEPWWFPDESRIVLPDNIQFIPMPARLH